MMDIEKSTNARSIAAIQTIDTHTLRNWLENKQPVNILDIRPMAERTEWFIPGSIFFNAYDKLKAKQADALQGLYLDKAVPVVAVCAGGKTSEIAAGLLQEQGFEAYSLKGGMKEWSLSWNTARSSFPGFEVIQFRRTGKGCLSYMIVSTNEAMIVDASLPIDVYQEILVKEKLVLKYVIETHIHADHLSRSKQLAESSNASLHLPALSKAGFDFIAVDNNTVLQIGKINVKAITTPGHTIESTSYLIDDKVLLTGDTLFINSVGRPDLKAENDEATAKSKLLFHSLQKLLALDGNVIVMPGHTSKPIDFDTIPIQASIADIRKDVTILKLAEEDFINTILQRIPPTPANYLSIAEKNSQGDFADINPVDLEAGANRCAIS